MPDSEDKLLEVIQKYVSPKDGKNLRLQSTFLAPWGDDAAVLQSHGKLAITVDMLVDKVHFDTRWLSPQEIGHRCLAVNLSDLSAMGALPRYALISLGLPPKFATTAWVRSLFHGISKLASSHDTLLIGGNLTKTPALTIDITAFGYCRHAPLLRSSALVGDWIGVTGPLGGAHAGLVLLRKKKRSWTKLESLAYEAYATPRPPIEIAQVLAQLRGVHAAIDLSDSLSRDLHHLADASNVGFTIDANKIPISQAATEIFQKAPGKSLAAALFGGDDYEILFTFDRKAYRNIQRKFRNLGATLYVIGEVQEQTQGRTLRRTDGEAIKLPQKGWDPFKAVRRHR